MKVDQLRASINADPARRQQVDEIKEEIRLDMRLEELRRHHRVTQEEIAASLGVSQSRVSKFEHQPDARLSSLKAYVEALGGHLEITAIFDEERIPLHGA